MRKQQCQSSTELTNLFNGQQVVVILKLQIHRLFRNPPLRDVHVIGEGRFGITMPVHTADYLQGYSIIQEYITKSILATCVVRFFSMLTITAISFR